MPNNVGIILVEGDTGGTTVTAANIPTGSRQALISFEVATVRANLRGVKATAASGGTMFQPGDVWMVKGNDYADALSHFTLTAITDGTTGHAILSFFDGFDRA